MERLTKRIDGKLVLKKKFPSLNDTIDILASRLELYEDTGLSPEQVQEVKGKQVPKPLKYSADRYSYGHCPICGRLYWEKSHVMPYCDMCGQKLGG